ncbi:DUF429 domain-containing protein [Streptomyces europaeiscabiei]|uniref:DUF429 domain-containing protein n=1 Tax=Streptomyces europaeiscabiei TaxID=146819 RepID=UPI002E1380CA|nr:DUF429 domain-containing protein [Streptomyces europaeiscabiei]
MERTIGVDLAVGSRTTAAAEIYWSPDGAEAKAPKAGCADKDLLELLSGLAPGERAGVDCPFGWPAAFVESVAAHASHQPWPGQTGRAEHYALLRLRTTDRAADAVVRPLVGRGPLSVSMDKLGATAARWAYLADQLALGGRPVDRTGAGPVVEVYPAGARAVWRLDGTRSTEALLKAAPWLRFEPGAQQIYEKNEHAFDALIAALVARATALGLTSGPQGEQEDRVAAVEGWIHLPEPDSLIRLDPSAL